MLSLFLFVVNYLLLSFTFSHLILIFYYCYLFSDIEFSLFTFRRLLQCMLYFTFCVALFSFRASSYIWFGLCRKLWADYFFFITSQNKMRGKRTSMHARTSKRGRTRQIGAILLRRWSFVCSCFYLFMYYFCLLCFSVWKIKGQNLTGVEFENCMFNCWKELNNHEFDIKDGLYSTAKQRKTDGLDFGGYV